MNVAASHQWLPWGRLHTACCGFKQARIDDGINCPGAFLWRLMIAGPFQGKGFGEQTIALLMRDLKARGFTELFVSYGQGPGSPEGFYRRLGFVPTGGMYGDDAEAVLKFAA